MKQPREWKRTPVVGSKRVEPKPWKIELCEGQAHFLCVNDAQIDSFFMFGSSQGELGGSQARRPCRNPRGQCDLTTSSDKKCFKDHIADSAAAVFAIKHSA